MNCPKCGEPDVAIGADHICLKCQIRILSDMEHSAGFYGEVSGE